MEEKIMHLLITEDDMALAQGLQRALQEKNRQVLCCKNIQETRQHLHQNQTDLLILDVNLPDGSGFDLLQEIRRTSDLPVILLTANDLEMDIVSGLEQGANDYITKPFQPPLLLAHIAAVLKRAKKADVPEKMICKGVELDVVRGCVKCQEQQVDLSKNELKILHYLFLHQGEIVPRIELVEYLWDQQVFIDDNALSVNITRLRAKLAEIGVCDFIETKRGMGYRI